MAGTKQLKLKHPASVAGVTVHIAAPSRKIMILGVFLVFHSIALKTCIDTSGAAHEIALNKRRKLRREHHLNGTKKEDMPPDDPLPSEWAPNPWCSALLFATLSLHAFFHLLCHWKIRIRSAALFTPAKEVNEHCFVEVTPVAHRGNADIVPMWHSESTGRLGFAFQRQRYEFYEPDEMGALTLDEEEEEFGGEVRLIKLPVDDPISKYLSAIGVGNDDQQADLVEKYGENQLEAETPSFVECYKQQLVSPLVVFQVFVALLWMADDFIQYTLMQLVFIFVFESTSVMQRLRTMKMLNAMGTKPYGIKVYRDRKWMEVSTADLLPYDLVELTARKGPSAAASPDPAAAAAVSSEEKIAPDIVPCDCVIIRGEAVVSEASLTGESAPQMKDSLAQEDRALDMNGLDRIHCLFAGTQLLRSSEGRSGEAAVLDKGTVGAPQVPNTPEGGCLAFVLRTAFASSQGELLQLIEFSQEKVAGDTKETIIALLVLLAFALVAAGYVLMKGIEKGEKTPHELLLKCVIILTAVVPRQLPMQMAVAVNTALMALLRRGVYCTEPFRVPIAGKLTHCLFDKTGTLTTDTLIPVGMVNADGKLAEKGYPSQVVVPEACATAAIVLSTCHSLVAIDGKLSGDPIELAAIEGVGWKYEADSSSSRPLSEEDKRKALEELNKKKPGELKDEEKKDDAQNLMPHVSQKLAEKAKDETKDATKDAALNLKATPSPVESAKIIQRFHFASALQRMAVIADLQVKSASNGLAGSGKYCLVKGSPEAVGTLLAKTSKPAWYDKAHTDLAESGLRVLALAYRPLTKSEGDSEKLTREDVESNLIFAGFIAFECKSRSDSPLVIGALRESDHEVIMLTGDAPLTALHVARTCAFDKSDKPGLLLTHHEDTNSFDWVVTAGERRGEKRLLSVSMEELAKEFTLMATGSALDAATEANPELWKSVGHIKVFARMTPQGKARVIRELQGQGRFCLMCGDGGNDVGALKQSDVGLALLAGYGNVNTSDEVEMEEKDGQKVAPENKALEDVLNKQQKDLQKRTKEAGKARQAFLWEKQKELNTMQRKWLEEELEIRAQRGETGMFAQAAAAKAALGRYTNELRNEMKEYDLKNGNVYDDAPMNPEKAKEDAEKKLQQALESKGLPMVRPGDASVAAPFTSKAPSVKNCVDLIRQGRCTLLSALQQQQIMMLNCIINAYVLSALSLEGSRSSERQMMGSQWLITTASLAFAYASPCERMHPKRPLRSLFHPAVFVSMLGQAVIHLACMVIAVRMARGCMEEGSVQREAGWSGPSLKDVSEFWRREKLKRRGLIEKDAAEEEDWSKMVMEMWFQPFLPNLMNTVVFLVETAQTVAVLFVNYKGQPWMKGVMENRALFLSVFVVAGSVAAAAWELSPQLNELIHLSPFPDDHFRWSVMALVFTTLVGTFVWDRFCIWMFAPDIFKAMLDSAKTTTFKGDILPIFKTAGKVIVGFLILGTGNLLVFAGVAFWYKKIRKQDDD